MTDRDKCIREALEGLRERCAQEAERITARRRTVAALLNNEAVKPCEVAAAIRKIDVQQHYECAVREIEALRAERDAQQVEIERLHGQLRLAQREAAPAVQVEPVAYIRQEDFEFILADDKSEPYGTRRAPVFSRKDCRAPVPLYASPQPQVQQADECGFTELTEKVAEIELAALEEALVKREKALAKWKANESIGMDEELEAINKEFHAACYAGRIQNVVYVLKAALADISRLRKAIECSRPINDSSAAPHNKHVAAFDAALDQEKSQ